MIIYLNGVTHMTKLVKSIDEIKIGRKYKVFYGNGNINNQILHVRGIVDKHIVCCWWRMSKQYFQFIVETSYYFELLIKNKHLYNAGKSNIKFMEET